MQCTESLSTISVKHGNIFVTSPTVDFEWILLMLPSRMSTRKVGQTGEEDTNWAETDRVDVMHAITKKMIFIYVDWD